MILNVICSRFAVDSEKLENCPGTISAGDRSFLGLGLGNSRIPTCPGSSASQAGFNCQTPGEIQKLDFCKLHHMPCWLFQSEFQSQFRYCLMV